ncbi:hypothetical protein [Streptomyces erythrochromogenes]|uniref:hypothetical protein n=1 Tax=Streptomyces erythrochromogenes TaxID=285574 RepID=UPI0036F502F1
MSLISAQRGTWFARFEVGAGLEGGGGDGEGDDWGELDSADETGSAYSYSEIVAWDAEGHALIVNVQGGCLRRANEVPGFTGLATAMEATAPPDGDAGDDD